MGMSRDNIVTVFEKGCSDEQEELRPEVERLWIRETNAIKAEG